MHYLQNLDHNLSFAWQATRSPLSPTHHNIPYDILRGATAIVTAAAHHGSKTLFLYQL